MWIIITLASLGVLIVLALSVPVDLGLHIDIHGRPKFGIRFAWLFGLVSKDMTGEKKKEKKKPEEKKGRKKPQPAGKGIGAGAILEILRTRGLLVQIRDLLLDILRIPRIKDFMANLRVGLGDPADTGLLFAFIGPAAVILHSRFPNRVIIQPSIDDDAVFEGFLHGKVRLVPIRVIKPVVSFVLSPAAIKAGKKFVVAKWRGKKS